MTPQKAIDILQAMIEILEMPLGKTKTRCLCGAYSYAINPNMTREEELSWTPNEAGLNELGLYRPNETFGVFWFEPGNVDVRIKYCQSVIAEWKQQLR